MYVTVRFPSHADQTSLEEWASTDSARKMDARVVAERRVRLSPGGEEKDGRELGRSTRCVAFVQMYLVAGSLGSAHDALIGSPYILGLEV